MVKMNCKFCGNCKIELLFSREITYYKCLSCSSIFSYPIPSEEEIVSLYSKDYWFERQELIEHPILTQRIKHDYNIALNRMDIIFSILDNFNLSLLDVGCSNGALVKRALELGLDAYGIEIDDDIANISRRVIQNEDRIFTSSIEAFDGFYNIIVMNDIIEHVREPIKVIEKICLMASKLIVIEAPDPESIEFKTEGINWRHLRYKEHLNLISIRILQDEMSKHDFILSKLLFPIPAKYAMYFKKRNNIRNGG